MSSIKLPNVEILAEYTSHLHFIIASKISRQICKKNWSKIREVFSKRYLYYH